jgi:hypothetical protein
MFFPVATPAKRSASRGPSIRSRQAQPWIPGQARDDGRGCGRAVPMNSGL